MMNFDFATLAVIIVPLLMAITVHEAAHGYAAKYCGDDTAAMLGRLTLNPINHIDPVGTIAVPLLMYIGSSAVGMPFIFGWAKPVPFNPRNFNVSLRKGVRIVAFAGPLANLTMMIIWALLLSFSGFMPASYVQPYELMTQYGVMINAVLFVLNMIPILPLDGGRVLDTFLPLKASLSFQKIEPYGTWIVLFIIFFPATRAIFSELVYWVSMAALIPSGYLRVLLF
ncbi:site-2 protease family protein [Neisseria sp. Ec49-e6-T10]|uniref:site-2 protease family protein n=1 Tax=Neisseria sp. Ec49-e6-T10 TaxID=3140744 RepID=UPI003EBAFD26